MARLAHEALCLCHAGFHFLYDADVAGLPPATVLEILQHEVCEALCGAQAYRSRASQMMAGCIA